jgi:hypothetical protein
MLKKNICSCRVAVAGHTAVLLQQPHQVTFKYHVLHPQGAFLDLRLFEARDPGLNLAALSTGGIRSLGVAEVGGYCQYLSVLHSSGPTCSTGQ